MKYLLVSDDTDESLNAIITSTVEIEERVKKALEEHYAQDFESISLTEIKTHPSLIMVKSYSEGTEFTHYLEEAWEY